MSDVSPGDEEAIFTAATVLDDSFAFLYQGIAVPSDVFSLTRAVSSSPAFNSSLGYYTLAGTLLDSLYKLKQLVILNETCLQGELFWTCRTL